MPQLRPFHELVAAGRNTEAAVKDEKVEKAKRLLDENLWVTRCLVKRIIVCIFCGSAQICSDFQLHCESKHKKSKKPFLFET